MAAAGEQARVLLVIPTLGRRPVLLQQALMSIMNQDVAADVVIVAPRTASLVAKVAHDLDIPVLDDPGSLPAAINLGIAWGGSTYDYVNWLNDDDLLEPGALAATVDALDRDPQAVVAFGACRYVNDVGGELWVSSAGPWASRILSWGPDLIPQPGMLVRQPAWVAVGGLDETYRLAFDLDLLLRLKKQGSLIYVGRVVSSFRWHGDSLTVDDRSTNIAESERAKRAAMGPLARGTSFLWQPWVRLAIRMAAREIQRRSTRRARPSPEDAGTGGALP